MEFKLTAQEMQTVRKIATSSEKTVESLISRLEKLTWGDGLLEFRMQSSFPCGLLPWMKQLLELSDQVNARLVKEGIPFGPSLQAYQSWVVDHDTE